MKIKRGEIYLVSFSFPHEGTDKKRPVIVLQCDEDNQNKYYPFVLIAPITTKKLKDVYLQDVLLPKGVGGLENESKVLLGALTAITKVSLIKRLGIVNNDLMTQINLKLLRIIGLLTKH